MHTQNLAQGSKKIRVNLPPLRKNETVKCIVEKHWITSAVINAMFLIFGAIPLGVSALFSEWLLRSISGLWFMGYLLLNGLYVGAVFFLALVHRRNEKGDIVVITNERLISHEQIDLFHRRISETGLAQIQDVKGIEKGFLQNVFRYGTLEITTASNEVFFRIKNIASPYEAARAILEARDEKLKSA